MELRWVKLRDELLRAHPNGDALLRGALADDGALLDPLGAAVSQAGLDGFSDPPSAALAALLQAAALLERPKFPGRVVQAGEVCRQGARHKAPAALGFLATKIERLLVQLAARHAPELREGCTLGQAIGELQKLGLLPLNEVERARWKADRRAVEAAVTSSGGGKGRRRSRDRGQQWNRAARALFAERDAERELPRYLAMLELQTIRNAYAHGDTRGAEGIDLPLRSWERMVGFVSLVLVNAFARGLLDPAPVPPPERQPRLRRWLYVTAAATVAVLVGTLGANLLAPVGARTEQLPQESAQAPPPDAPDGGEASLGSALASPSPPARSMVPAPVLAGRASKQETAPRSTPLCRLRLAEERAAVLPELAVRGRGGRSRKAQAGRGVSEVGARLQAGPGLGRVVALLASASEGRDLTARELERAVCAHDRGVLGGDEALEGLRPASAPLIVATVESEDDPRLPGLLSLAKKGASPRLLLVTSDPGVAGRAASVIEPVDFSCADAREALSRMLPGGAGEAGARLERWQLLPRGAEKLGRSCEVPAALRDLTGVSVVAAALGLHERPPEDHNDTWASWVRLAAAGVSGRDPGALAEPVELLGLADRLAFGVDANVGTIKRRKRCAGWVSDLGDHLGSAELLPYLAGTVAGRECAGWLAAGAVRQGLVAHEVAAALDRGLGRGGWRRAALRRAGSDLDRIPNARGAREVLGVLGE